MIAVDSVKKQDLITLLRTFANLVEQDKILPSSLEVDNSVDFEPGGEEQISIRLRFYRMA